MTSGNDPSPTTPGRPDEASSRQQKHPNQSAHTGSKSLDKESAKKSGSAVPEKPPGAK
jgi:hypothetical protein